MYTKKSLILLFKNIRDHSFGDVCSNSKVMLKSMHASGWSSPFDGNVYLNIRKINKCKLSVKSVEGLIAHELSHQVSYRKRSFISKWLYLWNYYLSRQKRKLIENEADIIAVERGYGQGLLKYKRQMITFDLKDKKRYAMVKQVYNSPQEIEKLIKQHAGNRRSK